MDSKPVILIVSANNETKSHLAYLDAELEKIRDSLSVGSVSKLFKLVFLEKANIQKLVDKIIEYQKTLVVLHYAGHASANALFLKSEYDSDKVIKANRRGLVPILSRCSSLKLVFLNGCSTQGISTSLIEHGIPVVIGTTAKVNDLIAGVIAYRFYHSLGQGLSIKISWLNTKDEIITRGKSYHKELMDSINRSPEIDTEESKEIEFNKEYNWRLDNRDGSEHILNWNLPSEAKNPLFALSIDGVYRKNLPSKPFAYMKRYEEHEHKIFFGRGDEIRQLYNLLQFGEGDSNQENIKLSSRAPIILFYGQTGVGKSSILQAGLLPRIKSQYTTIYYRRNEELGLVNGLQSKFKNILNYENDSFEELWLKVEQKSKKPILVIIDQMEECFTKPLNENNIQESAMFELRNLNQEIKNLFIYNKCNRKSKIIYSYRKEFHPDIHQSLKQEELGVEKVFVQPMQRSNIYEVVKGLFLFSDLASHYKFKKLDEGLAEKIANYLLEDETAAITPMLQIIMTDMWNDALTRDTEEIDLTVESFNRIKYSGLIDFVSRQFIELEDTKFQDFEKNGLILDLLYNFITSFNTAQTHTKKNVKNWYKGKDVDSILNKLKELSLLQSYDIDGLEKIALSHDTFAPIIRSLFMNSEREGQRARRIFNSALIGMREIKALNKTDLKTIENAKEYIKTFNEREHELIEISNRQKESRGFFEKGESFNRNGKSLKAKVAFALSIVYNTDSDKFMEGLEAYNKVRVNKLLGILEDRSLFKSTIDEYYSIGYNNKNISPDDVFDKVKYNCTGAIYNEKRDLIVTWLNFNALYSSEDNMMQQRPISKHMFSNSINERSCIKIWYLNSEKETKTYKYDEDINIEEVFLSTNGKHILYLEKRSINRYHIRVWNIDTHKDSLFSVEDIVLKDIILEAEISTGISVDKEYRILSKEEWYTKKKKYDNLIKV